MSEAPQNWAPGDKSFLNLSEQKTHRVELITKSLTAAGATNIEVSIGGERFTFNRNEKFIVMDIKIHGQKNRSALIYAHVFQNAAAWKRFYETQTEQGRQQFMERVPRAETEEDIDEGVRRILTKF